MKARNDSSISCLSEKAGEIMNVKNIGCYTPTYSGSPSNNAKIFDVYADKSVNIEKQDAYCKSYGKIEMMDEYYREAKRELEYNDKVDGQFTEIMQALYKEEISKEDVKQEVKRICAEVLNYRIEEGYTDGNDVQYNKKILARIYERAQFKNVEEAIALCLEEGKQIAEQYGGSKECNWMYYNSDYYYREKEICEGIQQAINEMSEEWGTARVDFLDVKRKCQLVGLEFNEVWQDHAWQRRISCMTDITAVPPQNLTFFYQEQKNRVFDKNQLLESQKGYIEITYENKKWQADVPYDRYGDRMIEFYRMGDFINKYLLGNMDSECKNFLSKFNIFTEIWASTQGDSIWL